MGGWVVVALLAACGAGPATRARAGDPHRAAARGARPPPVESGAVGAVARGGAPDAVAPIAARPRDGEAAIVDAYDAAVGDQVIAILRACVTPEQTELAVDYRVVDGVDRAQVVPDGDVDPCVAARLAELAVAAPPPRIARMAFAARVLTRGGRTIETRSRIDPAD